jgi:ABC-type proline/glycine betaine transport system permease subunit
LAFLAAAAIYVFTWNTPPSIVNRIQLVILAAAIIGIPLGIWLGGQEKFWT